MKPVYKYLAHAGLTAAMCIALALPTMAQRGGGGHSGGGGGGGGHVSASGGGFSGGGHGGGGGFSGFRSSGGFSGGRPSFSGGRSGAVVSRAGSFAGRTAIGARAGAVAPRGYVRSVTANNVGGHALANRGYVAAGGVYGHSYAGGGVYARPYAWGSHGGYFYSHGYYGLYYYPWIGFNCAFLPWGYYPFWWGGYYYYYDDGLFYTYNNDQYTVVEPPVGAEVNKLPAKAQSIVIDGQQYYEYNGVYYQPITKDNGKVAYEVAGKDGVLNTNGESGANATMPKVGDITYTLPEGCKKLKLNGQTLYVSDDGIYYQETTDANGKKAYKITAVESADEQ